MEITKRRIELSDNRYMEVEKVKDGFDISVWEIQPDISEDLLNVIDGLNPEDMEKIIEILNKFLSGKK